MARRLLRYVLIVSILLIGLAIPLQAQDDRLTEIIDLSVSVGYESFFRPGEWFPVRIEVSNNGESLTGRLVIRPGTSGTVVGNAYSTAIDLPAGAQKSATINIQARSFPDQIRVELIDDEGFIRASKEAPLSDIQQQDQLYVLVIGSTTQAIALNTVHIGGFRSESAIWNVDDIPENANSLHSVDMMLLMNIDSLSLTLGQIEAINSWVRDGGQLIVTGGPNWQATAQAFLDILPMTPDDTDALDNLTPLAVYGGDRQSQLDERTIIATGTVKEGAQVLVRNDDDLPLLTRWKVGNGMVDYLVADPTLEPLSSWSNLEGLWMTLVSNRDPLPTWTQGFARPQWGAESVANLPGIDLLPPVQTLCLFLLAYIVLIGPVNYLVLSRLNRNGWGWFTIPLIIIFFTVIAWTVGFNLRGSEIIVSRSTVVQTWADSDTAHMDQFIGILSPRRATYSLQVPEGYFLGVTGSANPAGLFGNSSVQTATEIQQASDFSANDFTVDGGIFANFTVSGEVPKPDISGTISINFIPAENGDLTRDLRGAVRNDSDIILTNAVIVAQNTAYRLDDDFKPGDIVTIEYDDLQSLSSAIPPQPHLFEYNVPLSSLGGTPFDRSQAPPSIGDLLGTDYQRARAYFAAQTIEEKEISRRQAFLASFMVDQFGSAARGNRIYLLGWSDEWTRDIGIEGGDWNPIDTTLYIIELDVTIELPSTNETVTVTPDQFTWMSTLRKGLTENSTTDVTLLPDQQLGFRFTPLSELILNEVDTLVINFDRGGGFGLSLELDVYNWDEGEWSRFPLHEGNVLTLTEPAPYLGPDNAVEVRVIYNEGLGTARLRSIRISQTGRFA